MFKVLFASKLLILNASYNTNAVILCLVLVFHYFNSFFFFFSLTISLNELCIACVIGLAEPMCI